MMKKFSVIITTILLLTITNLFMITKSISAATHFKQAVSVQTLQKEASQRIVVKSSEKSKTTASLTRFEKVKGKWIKVGSTVTAVIGKKGVGKAKEGDAKTPKGTFLLGTSFGWGSAPSGMKYPFRKATKFDYWIDDVKSKDYNKWVTYKGNPSKKWQSFERLTHELYKYAVVIRYNDRPIVKGKGSAIFLHMKKTNTKYTLGCVAISEKEIVKVIKWLDAKKKPIIVIE